MNQREQDNSTVGGSFRYMDAGAEACLYTNGQVYIERDSRGNTAAAQGIALSEHVVDVRDARNLPDAARMTCHAHGFELVEAPVGVGFDFYDHRAVINGYYPACERLVAEHTGAQVFAFDHNVRSSSGKARGETLRGGQDVQEPAHVVHGDYTLRGAPDRLRQLGAPPSGNDTLQGAIPAGRGLIPPELVKAGLAEGGRYAIINVWRNIDTHPVATHPLALCDARTVSSGDLVVFEIRYPDRVGENYFAKYSPAHEMYYFPDMTGEEALLIKQWDSAGHLARTDGRESDADGADGPCTFSFHSAFAIPNAPADAPDRRSIEVRCMVIYD